MPDRQIYRLFKIKMHGLSDMQDLAAAAPAPGIQVQSTRRRQLLMVGRGLAEVSASVHRRHSAFYRRRDQHGFLFSTLIGRVHLKDYHRHVSFDRVSHATYAPF